MLAEHRRKMAGSAKAGGPCGGSDRQRAALQNLLRAGDAPAQHVLVRRLPHRELEGAQEMVVRQPRHGGQFTEPQLVGEPLFDVLEQPHGWRSACSTVAPAMRAASQVRNGPPDAVRMTRSTVAASSPASA